MATQTPQPEGAAAPTQKPGMSPKDSAPVADQQPKAAEAKPAELKIIEEALGREFSSVEEAKKAVQNLNSFVGDQTIAKQRKALEKLAQQANLTPDELMEVIETQPSAAPLTPEPQTSEPQAPDATTKRLVRIETDAFVRDTPDAAAVRDVLFAEALSTGKTVQDIWTSKYAPVLETGKKIGAKKLQSNLEGQPAKAASTAEERTDTSVDFSGLNPETGKRWTSDEMEKFLGFHPPSPRL